MPTKPLKPCSYPNCPELTMKDTAANIKRKKAVNMIRTTDLLNIYITAVGRRS